MSVVLVQLAKTDPVVQSALRRIGNPHFALQRRADQRHATKGPQRQPAEALGAVAVDQSDTLTGTQKFHRRHDAGNAATDYQYVG